MGCFCRQFLALCRSVVYGDTPVMSLPDSSSLRRLANPPRPVPLLVRLRVLLGGTASQIGWVLFGFGMIFFWAFVWRADLTSWYRFRGVVPVTEGRVTRSSDTRASEGGSKGRRGTPIYKNEFTFAVDDKEYRNASYAVGIRLPVGRMVSVQYLASDPSVARIRGMRANVFGPAVLFVMLFPLAGFGLVVFSVSRGLRACRLLSHGVPTTGRLVSREATAVKENGRIVYKLTFEFDTGEGPSCTATARTNAPEKFKEQEEPLVYDPENPSRAVMLDNLPGAPHIGEDGHVSCQQPARALLSLVTPLATILGHGAYIWRMLIR